MDKEYKIYKGKEREGKKAHSMFLFPWMDPGNQVMIIIIK